MLKSPFDISKLFSTFKSRISSSLSLSSSLFFFFFGAEGLSVKSLKSMLHFQMQSWPSLKTNQNFVNLICSKFVVKLICSNWSEKFFQLKIKKQM